MDLKSQNNIDLSIIIPVYNETDNIKPVVSSIKEDLDKSGLCYEVLFIDDGSHDGTFSTIQKIHTKDHRFKAVQLKNNFGKSEAYMVGFEMASGDLVATMDGDLQDDPADLFKLIDEVRKGVDLVIGWKKTGKSSIVPFYLSKLFNFAIRILTKSTLHDLNCPLRVMTRDVAKNLDIYASLHRYIPILAASQGCTVNEVVVSNKKRLHGSSRYGYFKYFESFFDIMTVLFVTYYRKRPLQFLGPIGLISLIIGIWIDAYYFFLGMLGIDKMRNNIPSLLLGLTLIMIGMQIILSGLIGEMISRELRKEKKQYESMIKQRLV